MTFSPSLARNFGTLRPGIRPGSPLEATASPLVDVKAVNSRTGVKRVFRGGAVRSCRGRGGWEERYGETGLDSSDDVRCGRVSGIGGDAGSRERVSCVSGGFLGIGYRASWVSGRFPPGG